MLLRVVPVILEFPLLSFSQFSVQRALRDGGSA